MKRADLDKQIAKKIAGRMQREPMSERFGAAAGDPGDRRGQRERDKAAGRVAFAVKLPQPLVAQLQSIAQQRKQTLDELAEDLLVKALESAGESRRAEPR
jgi:cation transport regulator ChaB